MSEALALIERWREEMKRCGLNSEADPIATACAEATLVTLGNPLPGVSIRITSERKLFDSIIGDGRNWARSV